MSQGVESEAGEPGGKREYGTNRQPANRDTPIPAEQDSQDSVKQAGGHSRPLEPTATTNHKRYQATKCERNHDFRGW